MNGGVPTTEDEAREVLSQLVEEWDRTRVEADQAKRMVEGLTQIIKAMVHMYPTAAAVLPDDFFGS